MWDNAYQYTLISHHDMCMLYLQKRGRLCKMRLQKGVVYGLSNAYLDDTRGRVQEAKPLFRDIVERLGCGRGRNKVSEPISTEVR